MKNEKEAQTTNNKNEEQEKTLKQAAVEQTDQDLEQVAGGFTLIDMCQKSFNFKICLEAIWGECSQLQYTKNSERTGILNDTVVVYNCTCLNGHFKDYKHYSEY